MTEHQIVDVDGFKVRAKATWMAGDYGRVAKFTEATAEDFIARRHIRSGARVLDVACGTGNLAIPAARAGAEVAGIDIAPNLLDQARLRANREGVNVDFQEGDAETLPYQTGAFDLVVTMFGAMFAPRPDIVARELLRVCRAGCQVAMANWTPAGFVGELFRITGRHVAPVAGAPSPLQWGDEATVRERLASRTTDVQTTRLMAELKFPFSVAETIEFYRLHYGPTVRAFAALSQEAQQDCGRTWRASTSVKMPRPTARQSSRPSIWKSSRREVEPLGWHARF